ncbi:DUF551 domain-containing protein [Hoeflea sp.]|uniref:DUF551 domain-containing protein n=1 Tax=Hoeflea sp. TaxID=1940281 RepID=UPI001983762F|nr:DUF551 domain-containing protein [Hoeflea sp.]MBC7282601.1 DUF551 domain-containing protein [Hoeflea sp.]
MTDAQYPKWRPMSKAKKNGTRILAYYAADEGVYDIKYDRHWGGWVSHDYDIVNFAQEDFTHWMPLPEPPK